MRVRIAHKHVNIAHYPCSCCVIRLTRAQAWLLWVVAIAGSCQIIIGATQSAIWIRRQPDGSIATAYFFLVQTSGIWAFQQLINLIFLPMLNLRKFNGNAAAVTSHTSRRPVHSPSHMLQVMYATGRPCARGRFRLSPYYHFCGARLSEARWRVFSTFCVAAYDACILAARVMLRPQVHWEFHLHASHLFRCLCTSQLYSRQFSSQLHHSCGRHFHMRGAQ